MPAQIIDKGIPAPGLLAQVVIAKHDDHLPLYRQEEIYARSGVHIPRSSMAQWVGICGLRLAPLAAALREYILTHSVIHADETPVKLLAPGHGKTKRAYVWVYRTTDFIAQRAVLFDFCTSRAGEHPRRVLEGFSGTLVTDDFAGYHALHASGSVTAAFCMAHARRKLFEAHKLNDSQIAGQAVVRIAKLYEIERQARELDPGQRLLLRQQHSRPIAEALHTWLTEQRLRLAKADATAKAIDYTLSNWRALTRFLDDGNVPIDNNAAENAIRPLVIGRNNANSAFMRSRRYGSTRRPCMRGLSCVVATSHNHRARRNFIRALGGRYRAGFTSGGFNLANVRSFIARSASTYMCVVDGLSCPSHSAISDG